jgi:hypothetical protein
MLIPLPQVPLQVTPDRLMTAPKLRTCIDNIMDDRVAKVPAKNICPVIPLSNRGIATAFE